MKRNILTMLLLSVCLWVTAQNFDTSHSYVSERIYLNEEGTKYRMYLPALCQSEQQRYFCFQFSECLKQKNQLETFETN